MDRSLPSNYSYFASFVHYATPLDWFNLFWGAMVGVLGVVLAVMVIRTRWTSLDE